jgi:hypothetical protein
MSICKVGEDLMASLNSSSAQISIASIVDVILKGDSDGQKKEHIGEALQDIEPFDTLSVVTLTLHSRPSQRIAKVQAKSEAQKSHFMLSRV